MNKIFNTNINLSSIYSTDLSKYSVWNSSKIYDMDIDRNLKLNTNKDMSLIYDGNKWTSKLLMNDNELQGPKGDTGDVGPKGDTGNVGPKGDTGNVGPKGDTGNVGPKGDTGDVGHKGDTGNIGPKGDTGDVGPKGDTGDVGPKGDDGNSFKILGTLLNINELINITNPIIGDGYIIEYNLWVYTNNTNNNYGFVDVGPIRGAKGDDALSGILINKGIGYLESDNKFHFSENFKFDYTTNSLGININGDIKSNIHVAGDSYIEEYYNNTNYNTFINSIIPNTIAINTSGPSKYSRFLVRRPIVVNNIIYYFGSCIYNSKPYTAIISPIIGISTYQVYDDPNTSVFTDAIKEESIDKIFVLRYSTLTPKLGFIYINEFTKEPPYTVNVRYLNLINDTTFWTCMAYNSLNNILVILSNSGTPCAVSNDQGETFEYNSSGINGSYWNSCIYCEGLNKFVAVGNSGTSTNNSMSSYDGVTWYTDSLYTSYTSHLPSGNWYPICWSQELGMLCTVSDTGSKRIAISYDGKNWIYDEIYYDNKEFTSVKWISDLGLFIAVSKNSVSISVSNNGLTWSNVNFNEYINDRKFISTITWLDDSRNLYFSVGSKVIPTPDYVNVSYYNSLEYYTVGNSPGRLLYITPTLNFKIDNSLSSIYKLNSLTRGTLLPKMNSSSINGIENPSGGLIVYNSTKNKISNFNIMKNKWDEVVESLDLLIGSVYYNNNISVSILENINSFYKIALSDNMLLVDGSTGYSNISNSSYVCIKYNSININNKLSKHNISFSYKLDKINNNLTFKIVSNPIFIDNLYNSGTEINQSIIRSSSSSIISNYATVNINFTFKESSYNKYYLVVSNNIEENSSINITDIQWFVSINL